MYVTLEPCAHYGVTPPCTNIIKRKKIKNVYYSFNDPDRRTLNKAQKILKEKKILLKKVNIKDNNFYKSYFLNKQKNLPYLDAKIALSKDSFSINNQSKWITNYRSRLVGHLIRSKYDCIISTSKSINKDDSLLNCRIEGLNNNTPDLIIIDRNLKLKKKLKLYKLSKKRKTYIVTKNKNLPKLCFYKKKNIKIIIIDNLLDKKDFLDLLKKFFNNGKRRILVESGLTFLNKLIKFKLINNLYMFKSNKYLKKDGNKNSRFNFKKKIFSKKIIKVNLKGDKLFKIRIS